ncbi:MAG: hypothetical protein IJF50_08485 [Peptococcaceae bacterium]|nr:hypothetical protein [Peptococcaceae bacterium]MBQ2994247.1 hypothetical protein [Peptococcaceae bacterium]
MLLTAYPKSIAHLVERVDGWEVTLKPEATEEDYRKLEEHQRQNEELRKNPTHFFIEE